MNETFVFEIFEHEKPILIYLSYYFRDMSMQKF